ncbi:MAG TPA: DUF2171 domain-containing protein [Hyphomicrobiaceae bacterium]|nr:DUF2171 domain-containing protein [Hyphomicrobiaceae bacterium]
MFDKAWIFQQMDVIGSDGEHIGVVDALDGDRIKLSGDGRAGRDEARSIPLDWVEEVDDDCVFLLVSSAHVKQSWEPAL